MIPINFRLRWGGSSDTYIAFKFTGKTVTLNNGSVVATLDDESFVDVTITVDFEKNAL